MTQGINLDRLKTKYNKKINIENQIQNLENAGEEDLENIYQNINFNQVSDNKVRTFLIYEIKINQNKE